MEEITKEAQNLNSKVQQDFDKLIRKLKIQISNKITLKNLLEFLQLTQNQLNLNEDQVLILYSLFSQENGIIKPISRTIEQVYNKIKKLEEYNIRYNLNLLKTRGFVDLKKIGRVNNYLPKDLITIMKIEKDFQKKIGKEKYNRMIETIQHFNKETITDSKSIQRFSNFIDLSKILKLANKEILIIFPLNETDHNLINKNISKIFKILLNFINFSNILVKILINNQIKELSSDILNEILIHLPQIEIRTTSNLSNSFIIIMDEAYSIHTVENSLEFM